MGNAKAMPHSPCGQVLQPCHYPASLRRMLARAEAPHHGIAIPFSLERDHLPQFCNTRFDRLRPARLESVATEGFHGQTRYCGPVE